MPSKLKKTGFGFFFFFFLRLKKEKYFRSHILEGEMVASLGYLSCLRVTLFSKQWEIRIYLSHFSLFLSLSTFKLGKQLDLLSLLCSFCLDATGESACSPCLRKIQLFELSGVQLLIW